MHSVSLIHKLSDFLYSTVDYNVHYDALRYNCVVQSKGDRNQLSIPHVAKDKKLS